MQRLRKNRDFQKVYKSGRSAADKLLVSYCMDNGSEENRVGVSVSKKVGNSVVRHRMKRLVKEAFRSREEDFGRGRDIIFIVRKSAAEADFEAVSHSVSRLMKKMERAAKKE